MEITFGLMSFFGGFFFLGFGFAMANSIEAHKSEKVEWLMAKLCLAGAISFVIGFIGLLVIL